MMWKEIGTLVQRFFSKYIGYIGLKDTNPLLMPNIDPKWPTVCAQAWSNNYTFLTWVVPWLVQQRFLLLSKTFFAYTHTRLNTNYFKKVTVVYWAILPAFCHSFQSIYVMRKTMWIYWPTSCNWDFFYISCLLSSMSDFLFVTKVIKSQGMVLR